MRTQFKLKTKSTETISRFIEPNKGPATYSKNEKHFLGLKRFILRHKFVFLGMMLALLLLFRYLYNLTNTYKSEVTISISSFEIPGYKEAGNPDIPDFTSINEGMNRVYIMVYSKEMYDHLINKFNLYKHFKLDPANPSSYSVVRKLLQSQITLFQGVTRAITIQVTDRISGVMSAQIANEIAYKANEMNRKYVTEKIQNRVQVYTKLHDEIKSKTESDIASINQGIDQLNSVSGRLETSNLEIEKLLNSLNDISKKIEGDVGQLLRINNLNSWNLNAMQEDVMSNVLILQDALPGDLEVNLPKWLLIGLGLIASFFSTLFLFNLFYTYRRYLVLLRA